MAETLDILTTNGYGTTAEGTVIDASLTNLFSPGPGTPAIFLSDRRGCVWYHSG